MLEMYDGEEHYRDRERGEYAELKTPFLGDEGHFGGYSKGTR